MMMADGAAPLQAQGGLGSGSPETSLGGAIPGQATAAGQPRTVVVTGASRGIGAAVAAAFVAQGERVIGVSRSGEAPEGALGVTADVRDRERLRAALHEALAGEVADVLVACAGVAPAGAAVRLPGAAWEEALGVNLTGSFNAAQLLLPGMLARRRGCLIFVSSIIATRGGEGLAAYGASKAGLEGLTRSLAREVGGRGIRVNAVAPGFIETSMTAALDLRRREAYLAATPLGRFGEAAEVARPVLFLASEGASYINGVVLPVDGGLGMGR